MLFGSDHGFYNQTEDNSVQDHKKHHTLHIYYLAQEFEMKFRNIENANKNRFYNDP